MASFLSLRADQRGKRCTRGDRGAIAWNHSQIELLADPIIHVVGLCFGLIAVALLLAYAGVHDSSVELFSVSVYVAGLMSMLIFSAAYNLWPVCSTKWMLRRFDHSAIYFLIASTYTPIVRR
ncbi:MAG TPA: hemolysin III family protein [Bryobacteraceae bacterium]|jgi:hemolysin III